MSNRSRTFDCDYTPSWLELGWFVGKHDPYQDVLCVYCGEQWTDREHIFPYSWLERFVTPTNLKAEQLWTWIVPSCHECNLIASAAVFLTPQEKRDHIRQRLTTKHSKAIKSLEWTPEELRPMGPKMRAYIKRHQATAQTIKRRIQYDGKLPETIGSEGLVRHVKTLAKRGEARIRANGEVTNVA
jgi:hypothetical protein